MCCQRGLFSCLKLLPFGGAGGGNAAVQPAGHLPRKAAVQPLQPESLADQLWVPWHPAILVREERRGEESAAELWGTVAAQACVVVAGSGREEAVLPFLAAAAGW